MSKAIQGLAVLGVAGGLLAGAAVTGGADLAVAFAAGSHLFSGLVLAGASMEAGAIASALTSNRGTNITTRQAAAFRQVIYGEQRVGGVSIYQSTTGGNHDQYNYVIVLAGHECDSIVNLYLDGRLVYWEGSGPGWSVRNGVGFGGNPDSNDHTDEGNNKYNFHNLVYCEARFGDQLPGDIISGLTENDPTWAASAQGSPYVGGCTYVYLKVEYDATMFPSQPEIRFTVRGKNKIWDPRSNTTGYSNNWALCVADVLVNSEFGLGEQQSAINTAQLIAAANVSDQPITLAAGGTESQWTCNAHWDTSTGPGEMLDQMMPAAQGRLSRIGGQWFIWPAYWQGPSLSFGEGDVLKDFSWVGARPLRERYNRAKGTFTAPQFPYSVAGNLYDGNGFYDGTRQNNFNFEWQVTSAPYWAQDTLHGYASDPWLTADQGIEHWLDISHQCVISIGQAQRTFKIALLRNRLGAGRTTFTMSLAAYQAQPIDVMQFSYPVFGWNEKLLEVTSVRFLIEAENEGDAPTIMVELDCQETDPAIYEWSTTDELTITEQPASMQFYSYQVQPPTGLVLTDSAATAVVTPDGVVRPRISASWTAPTDAYVTQIQVQMQLAGASSWLDAKLVDAGNTATYVDNVVASQSYNVRIRGLTPRGAGSAWLTGSYTVSSTHSSINSLGLAPGLIGTAPNNATVDSVVSGSTATVRVYGPGGVGTSFTQYLSSQSMTLPGASFTGEALSTSYQVLYNTSSSTYSIVSGSTNPSDSYIVIGAVTTPAANGTGGKSGGGGRGGYQTS